MGVGYSSGGVDSIHGSELRDSVDSITPVFLKRCNVCADIMCGDSVWDYLWGLCVAIMCGDYVWTLCLGYYAWKVCFAITCENVFVCVLACMFGCVHAINAQLICVCACAFARCA